MREWAKEVHVMLDNQRVAARAYRITKLRLEAPAPDGEIVSVELDGAVWIKMSRYELRDLDLFRISVERQMNIRLPRAHDDQRAKAIWRQQLNELLFQADHQN